MRWIGRRCSEHFFSSVEVIGGESVPAEGPFILVCTHFSTIMDVAIISAHLPHNRPIHYWAKKGLYRGKLFAWILNDSGNIQVDRQTKSNQDLFKGTFDAMQAGEAIGLFPEGESHGFFICSTAKNLMLMFSIRMCPLGGSFTEPKLHSIKAGAAWAALEYAKFLALDENGSLKQGAAEATKTGVKIVPASINYTEKSRFRSNAVFHIGEAFSVDEFTEEFLSASLDASNSSQDHGNVKLGGITSEQSSFPFSAPQTPMISTPAPGSDNETSYLSAASITTAGSSATDAPAIKAALNSVGSSAHGVTRRSDRAAKAAVQKLTDRIGTELNHITINAPDWKLWHAMKISRELFWAGRKNESADLDVKLIVPLSNACVARNAQRPTRPA